MRMTDNILSILHSRWCFCI